MASPLSLYVPLQQTLGAQAAAQIAYASFKNGIGPGLDMIGNVLYARLTLIPNKKGSEFPVLAILLITDFDDNMKDYLNAFWISTNVKQAFIALATMMLDGPADPASFDFDAFKDFIVSNNLNKENPEGSDNYEAFYEAYPGVTVTDIHDKFPDAKNK